MAPFTGLEDQTKPSLEDKVSKGTNQDIVDSQVESEIIGLKWRYITNTVTRFGKNYYNFTGLRNFIEKYNPYWEPCYLSQVSLKAWLKAALNRYYDLNHNE